MLPFDFEPFDFDFGPGRFGGVVGGILGLVFTLAVIALVVLAILYLVRRLRAGDAGQASARGTVAPAGATYAPAPARALLDERFARGEIDEDEYARRRALLDGAPPAV